MVCARPKDDFTKWWSLKALFKHKRKSTCSLAQNTWVRPKYFGNSRRTRHKAQFSFLCLEYWMGSSESPWKVKKAAAVSFVSSRFWLRHIWSVSISWRNEDPILSSHNCTLELFDIFSAYKHNRLDTNNWRELFSAKFAKYSSLC